MNLLELSREFTRSHSFGLGLLISTGFLALAVSFTGLEAFFSSVSRANFSILLLGLFVANIPVLIYSLIWKKCMFISGIGLTLWQVLKLNLAAVFINNITPLGNIGGEPFVAKRMSQYTDETFETMFSIILVADLVTFSPIVTSFVLGTIILILGLPAYFSVQLTSIFLVLTILTILLYYRRFQALEIFFGVVRSSANYVESFSGKSIGVNKRISDLSDGLSKFSSFKKTLSGLALLAHTGFLADITAIFLVSVSIGEPVGFFMLFVIVPLSRIANYAPTPGGSGFYEAGLSGLLVSLGGISLSAAVSVTIIYRFITYYVGILLGYFAFNSQNYDM